MATLVIAGIDISTNASNVELTLKPYSSNENDMSFKVSLKSVNYHKKIYQPGSVTAKVKLDGNPSPVDIVKYFTNQSVSLLKDTKTVASDYYIYKVCPEYKAIHMPDGSNFIEVFATLYCYSRDHKLTLTPYCKTYINKKLCGTSDSDGIISKELKDGILKAAGFTNTSTSPNIDFTNLRLLKYFTDSSGSKKEFIQPYLVQYNESFYDFLARTTNRCGEFLYHENGILHIGIPDALNDQDLVRLDASQMLSYRYVGYATPVISSELTYMNGMDLGAKDELYAGGASYFSYDELPVDEYLGMLLQKDGFTTFEKEYVKDWWYLLTDTLNIVLNASSITTMLKTLITKNLTAIATAGMDVITKNKEKNAKWIDKANVEQKDVTKKLTTVTLYGSLLSEQTRLLNYEEQQNLNAKFYRFVNRCCSDVAQQLVEVETGSTGPVCSLGDRVSFNRGTYVVIEIKETLLEEDGAKEQSSPGQVIVLAPKYSAPVKKYKADSDSAATLTFFCPPAVVPFVKKSSAQRAFVAKNGDPEGYGRVCIRYPWQQKEDTPSPWIRMVVPFAPNNAAYDNAGIFFEPSEGDEVLVEYENGNIEHPYVAGSLFTRRVQAPKGGRRIESCNGHALTFNDKGSITQFMAGIYPGVELLEKAVSGIGSQIKDGWGFDDVAEDHDFTGGITLTDKWGFYKISASTTDRNISIKSPLGDISISALTGITLSAPNGDITIKGKNISIEAGNDVKIVSGKYIDEKKGFMDAKGAKGKLNYVGNAIDEAVRDLPNTLAEEYLAPFTDLSFLRTVVEAFLKPVTGSLTIQAGRYLILNAGGGKAEIPNKGYNALGLKKIQEDNGDKLKLLHTLRFIQTQTDTWLNSIQTQYGIVKILVDEYKTNVTFLTAPAAANIVNIVRNATKAFVKDDLTFADPSQNTDLNCDSALARLTDLQACIKDITDYCTDITNGNLLGGNDDNKKYYIKELKEVLSSVSILPFFPDIIQSIINKAEQFDKNADIIDTSENKKLLYRMLAERVIEKTSVLGQKPDQSKGETKVVFNTADDYRDETTWTKYVGLLDLNPDKKGWFGYFNPLDLGQVMTENLPSADWLSEHRIWDTCKQGEILFSDKGGKETINIVNGVLTRTANIDEFKEQLKDTLRNL